MTGTEAPGQRGRIRQPSLADAIVPLVVMVVLIVMGLFEIIGAFSLRRAPARERRAAGGSAQASGADGGDRNARRR